MTIPAAWDPNNLWKKATCYAERASQADRETDDGMLFACFALELLARAALTAIHPALNADPQNEGAHLMFACGIATPGKPRSVPIHSVLARLAVAYPEFKPHVSVCDYLVSLRNEELHSGLNSFQGQNEAKWLADYYGAVDFLCTKLGKSLDDYLFDDAEHARALVESKRTERRAELKKRIAAQRTLFDALSEEERVAASARAGAAARFRSNRIVACPACENPALIDGDEIKRSEPTYADRELTVSVTCATSDLKCAACGLHLKTVEECAVSEIVPRFTVYETISLHDIHQDQWGEEYDNM